MITGYKDSSRENRTRPEPATLNHISPYRDGLDTSAITAYATFLFDTAQSSSTTTTVVLSAPSSVLKGDLVVFTSGAVSGHTAIVDSYSGSTITLSQKLSASPVGCTLYVARPSFLQVDSGGRARVANTEYGPSGLPNFYANVFGIVEIPLSMIGDPNTALIAGISGGSTPADTRNALQITGNVAHDATDDSTAKPIKIGGKTTDTLTVPTPVTTIGNRTNAWFDKHGALDVRAGYRHTYHASFKDTARPWSLSKTFGAAGSTQIATLSHKNSAIMNVRILKVDVQIKTVSAATTLMFEIRQLSAVAATGTPTITPIALNPGSPAAEIDCFALPATPGTEVSTTATVGTIEMPYGITGAASVINPPPSPTTITLFDARSLTESFPLIIRAGQSEGWAVIMDSSAAATITFNVNILFTED